MWGIERQGYKLRLINVVNGTAVNTEEWSTGVNSINTYLNIYLSLDLSNKKMKIVGSNGTPTTIYTFDFSSWSLSSLDTFKIRTSGGKYSGHQYNIYLRTNDYYDYESLLNLKFQVNSYNVLPIIADGEGNYTPTTLYIEGSNIVTTSDTHKTADVSISPLNYFMLSSGYDDLLDKYYVSSLVRFKITSGSAQIHAGVGITAFFLMDENSNILYNGIGASENYTLTNNTWYYLYIVGVGNQTYNYTRRYNAKFEGTFTIEAEALSIGYPRSMNCCAENFDGKYFSGAIPMVSDKTTFTEVAFAKTMNGYQAPIGAIVVDSGVMYIYNGTAWIDYSKFIVNKATGTDSLTIFGTAATANNAINIGATSSMAGGSYSVGIGYGAKCNSSNAVAIGRSASVGSNARDVTAIGYNARIASNADYAIQLGNGQNSTAKTLSVGFNTTNYQLLDGTTGLIPDARISSNIARASDIPTYTAGTGIDITSNTISVTAPTLTNTATGSDSLTILGTPITYDNGINIGKNTVAYGGSSVIIGGESRDSSTFAHADCVAIGYGANCQTYYSIAIGYEARTDDIEDVAIGYSTAIMENATKSVALGNYAAVGDGTTTIEGGTAIGSYSWANGEDATAIGHRAVASADSAVQIGYGTNNEANSFYVATSSSNNWKMLDSAGLIPDARISSNIARASDIPTIDQTYDGTSTNAQSGTAIAGLLEAIYPVGSVYIGTQATCPMSTVMSGTTWTLISSEKALWTGDGTNGGTTINAGLPDITGSITLRDSAQSQSDVDGAFAFDTTSSSGNWTGTNQQTRQYFKANFSASSSNAIYGASNTVQPPAYVVNVWERTA